MNFIDVTVERYRRRRRARSAPATGPSRCRRRPRAAIGAENTRTLVAGFRPEHLDIGEASPSVGSFRARADVVEYLGNEELLHVNAADKDIVAIVDSEHRVKPGDIVNLIIPLEKLHLFDGETGAAMTAGDLVAATA